MRRGSAAPTRTPMACCASTYPRALTCRCSRKPNSTPSPPGSTAGRARRLALRHPMRCSPRWWTRPPTPSRHEMRRVFVMELESAASFPAAAQHVAQGDQFGQHRFDIKALGAADAAMVFPMLPPGIVMPAGILVVLQAVRLGTLASSRFVRWMALVGTDRGTSLGTTSGFAQQALHAF